MHSKSNISIEAIERRNLRHVDLNLLTIFAALMETRSVTRAADRLGLGQPAASHALKKLRQLLGDPLFVRNPTGMVPTPRALALDAPVRAILSNISDALFAGDGFEPGTARSVFRVGATDYAQMAIAEPLLAELVGVSPMSRLILTATDCQSVGRALETGEIDLAFGAFPQLAWTQRHQHLYDEDYACVYDAAVCGIKGPLTMEQWLALPHAIMSTRGDYVGPIDAVLGERGLRRHIATSTPHFLAMPYLLQGKAIVGALPMRLARRCAAAFGLAVCPLPFAAPRFAVSMIWTPRTDNEPGLIWLRDQIVRLCVTAGQSDDFALVGDQKTAGP